MAMHNLATLTIVDVVPDFSWATRVSLQDHEHVRQLLRREKSEKLEALAAPFRDKGIKVETKLLEGKTSVEVIRQVLNGDHDLVMAISKGARSRCRGFFGQTARRLLRNCPSSVWLVAPGASSQIKHAMACVDTSTDEALDAELNDKIYELASSISKYHDCLFSVVHAWLMQDDALLSANLKPKVVAEYERSDHEYREKLLDKFLRQYDSSGSAENIHVIKGETSQVISDFVHDKKVDLVVMGTVARSGLTGMLMGNTSERILDRIECSVLAVKPYSFKCPIRSTAS
jgi:nucleotide-binding universal stress UspA family protein